jgi:methionyl-tRNA formyltransferase
VKALFMGTPEFATSALRAMLDTSMLHTSMPDSGIQVLGVITQPDRPAGRGQQLLPSPVKRLALERGLAVFQPVKIKDPEAVEYVRQANPDVIVVVGYGQIIPRAVFDLPPLGTINVHASLLPKYRGAAPIQWAIANGEIVTGVTTMRIEAGLDTGDILLQRELPIGPNETSPELAARLATAGAELLIETLRGLQQGTITPRKQDASQATLAPILRKEDGRIDWNMSARQIFNRVRGFDPWPGAYTTFRGQLLHLRRVRVSSDAGGAPGAIVLDVHGLRVACGPAEAERESLEILELQPEGKKRMSAQDFINGRMPKSGEILGETS